MVRRRVVPRAAQVNSAVVLIGNHGAFNPIGIVHGMREVGLADPGGQRRGGQVIERVEPGQEVTSAGWWRGCRRSGKATPVMVSSRMKSMISCRSRRYSLADSPPAGVGLEKLGAGHDDLEVEVGRLLKLQETLFEPVELAVAIQGLSGVQILFEAAVVAVGAVVEQDEGGVSPRRTSW